MPVAVLVLGLIAAVMFFWEYRIGESRRMAYEQINATVDIHNKTANFHLWFEEAIAKSDRKEMGRIFVYLDAALRLTNALCCGGTSEHGTTLAALEDPVFLGHAESIRGHLLKFRDLAGKRYQNPRTAGIGSALDEEFNALFRKFQKRARTLELAIEKKQLRERAKARRFTFGIAFLWAGLVAGSAAGLYNRERRRRQAELALEGAYGEMEQRVVSRTAELAQANSQLRGEVVERQEAEAFLRASEHRFRTLVENIPLRIFLKDHHSLYLYGNDNCARDLGIEPQEIFGKTDYDLYPEELAKQHIAEDERILKSGKTEEGEERYLRQGQEVVIKKIKLPIKYEGDDIMGILGIAWDITEKMRLESIAEAASMMDNIGYVFAGISHEIGNPINTIKLTLKLLESKMVACPNEICKTYIERTMAEIARVQYLLKSFKNFKMYETPELQSIPLQPFLESFLSLVRDDFEKKGISLRSEIDQGTEQVCADPRALQQVLLNILSNAADALEGRENPEIALQVGKTDGLIRIGTRDNGRGMSAEQQQQLFKPFVTTKPGGTGLGLVIIKKMLTAMQGGIKIKSQEGVGTTVDIYLPGGFG